MKSIYHCIIPFLVLCVDLHAQQIISNSLVETENPKIIGIPMQTHFRDLDYYLDAHPEIDLRILDRFDSGNMTQKNYLIGLVIVNLIQKRCGHHKLLEALETVHTDDELLKFIEKNMDIEEKDINSLIRAEVKHYANFGYSGKW